MLDCIVGTHGAKVLGIPKTLSIGIPNAIWPIIVGMTLTLGERMKLAREELQKLRGEKPNQAAYAREIGIEPPSLSAIESGDTVAPASETLLAIRDTGINPDFIMRGDRPRLLLSGGPRRRNQQTILGIMEDLDNVEQQVLVDMATALARKKPEGSGDNKGSSK
jgi:transcriptional regulator with XRE-family HTH domain